MKLFKLYGEHPSLDVIKEKFNNNQIYSTSLVTLTGECQNNCLPCFTEAKRRISQKIDPNLYDDIMRITSELGGEAIRIVGRGEPLLDDDLELILKKAKEYNLWVVLFSNLIDLTKEKLDKFKELGNISIMTKLWGDSEMMSRMTSNTFYKNSENIINRKTRYGDVQIQPGIEMILNSDFHKVNCEFTNFGIEFMVTEMNYAQLVPILAFMIENNISPYIRTPFPIANSEGFTLKQRNVDIPSKEQFEEINKSVMELLNTYGIFESFRLGSDTFHCMRTTYNFVFELIQSVSSGNFGKLIAQPCHHTKSPRIEITHGFDINSFKEKFFNLDGYKNLRGAILEKGSIKAKKIDLQELMDGCVCANYYK